MKPNHLQLQQLRTAFEQLLAGANWLGAEIPEAEWLSFTKNLQLASYDDNETLVAAGDHKIVGGFVLDGCVRASYLSLDGDEHNRYFAAPGHFFAPLAAGLTGSPSEVTLTALGDTSVIVIDLSLFLDMYNVSATWDRIGRRITEMFYLIRERHAQQLLTLDAKARWLAFLDDYGELAKKIPQKHIASYLGIRPETLARLK